MSKPRADLEAWRALARDDLRGRDPETLVRETPDGLRVFTPHRCTCRSLGERAPLDAAVIAQEITVADVPPAIEWRVSAPLALAPGRRVSFAA